MLLLENGAEPPGTRFPAGTIAGFALRTSHKNWSPALLCVDGGEVQPKTMHDQ